MADRWRTQPNDDLPDGLILFDGVCLLCSGWVRFIIPRDPAQVFRFVPIQSTYGQMLAQRFGIDSETPESNAVVGHNLVYFKSDAAIHVLSRLPGWSWIVALQILPKALRDWLYDRIAQNRYRLFGRSKTCMMPTPETAQRFVLDPPTTH